MSRASPSQPPYQPPARRPVPVAPPFISRPTWLDYLLILGGVCLSMWLYRQSGLTAQRTALTPPWLDDTARELIPQFLLLPVGIVLLWPVFYTTQRLVGRPLGLTGGEWLWGVSWLIAVALTVWVLWQKFGTLPESLQKPEVKEAMLLGYAVAAFSLAGIAVLLFLIDLIGRWKQPWTHQLSLVLALWPVLPLAALMLWKIELK